MHPFRFGVMSGPARSRREWLGAATGFESMGYSTLFTSDHFSNKLAPLPALLAAAEHTGMRVGTLVLANDFRHPAVLAKEAATVDLLTEGRLELGIGTGWARRDYETSGIRLESPGTQVDRFEEAVAVLKGLWGDRTVRVEGEHYQVHLDGHPKPGPGRPTLLIGGGARRMLRIAGENADIVGISPGGIREVSDLDEGIVSAAERIDRMLEWIARGAGGRFQELELNILVFDAQVSSQRKQAASEMAKRWGGTPDQILSSPHFLVGSTDQIVSDLTERRERWGISYPVIPTASAEELGPVVEALTGI